MGFIFILYGIPYGAAYTPLGGVGKNFRGTSPKSYSNKKANHIVIKRPNYNMIKRPII